MDNNFKILIIEDIHDNRISLKALINEAFPKAVVLTAHSGKSGIDIARKESPDIILLDILMPEMDGYEVCRILKADENLCNIPIVFVTALKENPLNKARALEVGAEGFLTKPLDRFELKAQINAMLKIKMANELKNKNSQLFEHLVAERTKELQRELQLALEIKEKFIENEKFKNITETSPSSLVISRLSDGLILYVNEQCAKMLGIPVSELLNQFTPNFYANLEDRKKIILMLHETSEIYNFEVLLKRSDETTFLVLFNARIANFNGEKAIFVGFNDVTEPKQTKKSLQQASDIIENMQIGLYVYELENYDDDRSLRLVAANPASGVLSGVLPDNLIGKYIDEIFPELRVLGIPKRFAEVVITGKAGEFNDFYYEDEHVIKAAYAVKAFPLPNHRVAITFDNVTERKMMEDSLRLSEEKYRSYIQHAPDGVIITNETGNYIEGNNAACKITGYSEDELVKLSITDLLFKEDLALGLQHFHDVKEKGFARGDMRLTRKNGDARFCTIAAVKISNNRFLGYVKDITERKQAEQDLKNREHLLNKIFETLPIGLWFADNEGKLIRGNPAGVKIWGAEPTVPMEEYGVFKARHLPSRKEIEPNDWALAHTIKKGVTIENELLEIDTFDGRKRIILNYTAPVLDDNGDIQGAIVVNQDITERKKAEEELIKSEAKYRQLADNITDVVWTTDMNFNTTYVSPSIKKLIGVTPQEYIEMGIDKKHPPAFLNKFYSILMQELEKEKEPEVDKSRTLKIDGEHYKPDGSIISISIHAAFIRDENGNPIGIQGVTNDITERKKAEKALHESEERFKALHNASFGGIAIHDKGIILECNQGLSDMTGYTLDELIGMDGLLLIAPNSRDFVLSNIIADYEKPYEALGMRKNGELFPMRLEARNIPYKGKNVRTVEFRDITESKQAEEELRKSEAIKYKMLSNIGDVIVIIDQNGINQYKSPNITTLFGWKPEELVGKSTWDTVHPDDLEAGQEFIASLAAEPYATKTTEIRYKCKDGSYVWIEITVANLFADTDIKGLLGNYHDISERKKEQERNQLLTSILDYSQDFIGLATPDQKAFYINPAGQKMLGIDGEEMARKTSVEDYFFPEDLAFVHNTIMPILMKEGRWAGEFRFKNFKTNEPVHIYYDLFLTADPKTKKITNISTISRDITADKKNEIELIKAKEKAQESDRLKSAFLANMSHEIRTPMNGIMGFAQLLKDSTLSGKEQQEYIRIIEKSGHRMLNIINDIVDISKIEAGLMKINLKPVNINEQLDYIYHFFKHEAINKKIQIVYHKCLPDTDVQILSDYEKVIAIFTNLIKNAVKFTNTGFVEFGYTPKSQHLEFYVKDTGIGISKERHEAIFERFIQADITNKSAHQGAGLGLAITKAYVEMLGGKIWMESEINKGSSFFFTLPLNANDYPEIASKDIIINYLPNTDEQSKNQSNGLTPQKPNSTEGLTPQIINKKIKTPLSKTQHTEKKYNLKILIAEDDMISEMVLSKVIECFSKEIIIARDGLQAVEAFHKNADIDLVFMDIQMPNMNGYDATKEIRKHNKDVVIIAQTAFGLSDDKEKAINAGCTDYLKKPVNIEALKELLNKYF